MQNFICGCLFISAAFSRSEANPIYRCKTLDLTHTLNSSTPYYPGFSPFKLERKQTGQWGTVPFSEYNYMCSYEHIGTHVDAPGHFSKHGKRVDKVELKHFVGEACVMDISAKVVLNRDYSVTVNDVKEWEAKHGEVDSNCIFLLYTGQDRWYFNKDKFLGTQIVSGEPVYHFAAFTEEVAKYIVAKKVRAVGLDTISLDMASNPDYKAHLAILDVGGIPGLENVANLGKLPPRGASIIASPLKIGGGSGSPIRAFAVGWNGPDDPCNKQNLKSEASPIQQLLFLFCILGVGLFCLFISGRTPERPRHQSKRRNGSPFSN